MRDGGPGDTVSGAGGSAGAASPGSGGSAGAAGNVGSGGKVGAGGAPGAGGALGSGGSAWPQCYANDTMPVSPGLTVDPAATGWTTKITSDYVAMLIGSQRPSCLTDTVAQRDVDDLTSGLRDVVEKLGFPKFPNWTNGYYLNWVILNSGIAGATLANEGGYQGNRWGHMDFESTQQCPCTWDTYNSGAALHECIHALQAELYKFNNEGSGWIHEAHNCYLGTQRELIAHNKYTMGYGAAVVLTTPHIPIEAMGLLTDDTVGGPADQGAQGKTYVNSVYRYGLEIVFLSLNLAMGRGFINCLWIEAPKNNQKSVFQILEGYAGKDGIANAILSFGARTSLLDFGGWTDVMRSTMKGNWPGLSGNWFYVYPTADSSGWMSPPTKQIPHHQGRNIIPIKLASGATEVVVELQPGTAGSQGTPQNMQAQLTYRTTDDKPVYGTPFSSGSGTIQVPNGARNGLVNLVIAVTNANAASGGDNDGSNKGFYSNEHFNYKARIVSGGTLAPTNTVPW